MRATTVPVRLAATVAAVALLAGCGAFDGDSGDPTADPGATRPRVGPPDGTPPQGHPTYDEESPQGVAPDRPPGPAETDAREDPLSTFALDVDTASYGFVARSLRDGRLPSPAEVRPEEFVNAFRQDYPEPEGDGFSVSADGTRLPFVAGSDTRLMRVGLQTRSESPADRRPARLTFVVDVSGSMAEPGRLDLVKDALHTLVGRLGQGDAVGVVAYSDRARVVTPVLPVERSGALHSAVDELVTEGSTNLEEGLVTGYRVARDGYRSGATNRVVLLTDGLANTGSTDATTILAQVREQAGKGIALLTVGVGSEYGDALMEQLADRGDGIAAYVSDRSQAETLFTERLPATGSLRALDAKAQVSFDPGAVSSYRLLGYEDRAVADEDFRDDAVDGGEVGPGHSTTALYVVRLRPGAQGRVAQVRVRWADPADRSVAERSADVEVGDLAGELPSATPRLRVDAVAAVLAERLRGSPAAQRVDLGALVAEADRLAEELADPQVAELAELVRQAAGLLGGAPEPSGTYGGGY